MTDAAIRPFRIHVPDDALDDLRDRLGRVRWPVQMPGTGWERGVPVDYLRPLVQYWREDYDWRPNEAELNSWPQFTTEIDGATLHFLQVRSPHPGALPLILSHGWPGSVVEFLDVIAPLTDPVAHGGDAADAFDLVIPSLPGFGFSGPAPGQGWSPRRIAAAFAELMDRLGYGRYLAQGGDFGSFIAPELGRIDPDHVAGVHVNAAAVGFIPFGKIDEGLLASFTEVERDRLARSRAFTASGNGYLQLQKSRPQTLAYSLADSPVGQLAWIIEKFKEWSFPADALPDHLIDRDRLLTNVMVYWLTSTGGSSAQLYYETFNPMQLPSRSEIPTGVAVFADDVAIRHFAELGNRIVHWSDFDEGGHFAALEVPELLVEDIRCFARLVR